MIPWKKDCRYNFFFLEFSFLILRMFSKKMTPYPTNVLALDIAMLVTLDPKVFQS